MHWQQKVSAKQQQVLSWLDLTVKAQTDSLYINKNIKPVRLLSYEPQKCFWYMLYKDHRCIYPWNVAGQLHSWCSSWLGRQGRLAGPDMTCRLSFSAASLWAFFLNLDSSVFGCCPFWFTSFQVSPRLLNKSYWRTQHFLRDTKPITSAKHRGVWTLSRCTLEARSGPFSRL